MTNTDDSPIYPRNAWWSQRLSLRGQLYGLAAGMVFAMLTVVTSGAGLLLYVVPMAGLFSQKWRATAFATFAAALALATVGPGYLLVQTLAGR